MAGVPEQIQLSEKLKLQAKQVYAIISYKDDRN